MLSHPLEKRPQLQNIHQAANNLGGKASTKDASTTTTAKHQLEKRPQRQSIRQNYSMAAKHPPETTTIKAAKHLLMGGHHAHSSKVSA
jgi:hypothetical protein